MRAAAAKCPSVPVLESGCCERLLPGRSRRTPRWRLQEALEAYQRKHMIVSRGLLGRETRRAFAQDSRELDFRALLRSLRARVIDATGVIEDGTALGARGTILSRHVDGDAFYEDEAGALEGGAPDLVSPATEAAAQALGWTDPRAAAEFFRRRGPGATRQLTVALRLPPVPGYHAEHMDLRVEIDRGDVWYELPERRGSIGQRPTLTLYARTSEGEEVALVRWPTTIGGWKKEAPRDGAGQAPQGAAAARQPVAGEDAGAAARRDHPPRGATGQASSGELEPGRRRGAGLRAVASGGARWPRRRRRLALRCSPRCGDHRSKAVHPRERRPCSRRS